MPIRKSNLHDMVGRAINASVIAVVGPAVVVSLTALFDESAGYSISLFFAIVILAGPAALAIFVAIGVVYELVLARLESKAGAVRWPIHLVLAVCILVVVLAISVAVHQLTSVSGLSMALSDSAPIILGYPVLIIALALMRRSRVNEQ